MSIQARAVPPAATPSLREIAAAAWQRQQAEVASELRQELDRKRDALIDNARAAVRAAFAYSISDPRSPIRECEVDTAEVSVLIPDERVPERSDLWIAEIVFHGETFHYRCVGDGWGLFHRFACSACQEVHESSYPIDNLAELGEWLERATVADCCSHRGVR